MKNKNIKKRIASLAAATMMMGNTGAALSEDIATNTDLTSPIKVTDSIFDDLLEQDDTLTREEAIRMIEEIDDNKDDTLVVNDDNKVDINGGSTFGKTEIDIPIIVFGLFEYTGSEIDFTPSYDSSKMTLKGTTKATEVGKYSFTLECNDGYIFMGGKTEMSFGFEITKKKVSVPTGKTIEFVFDNRDLSATKIYHVFQLIEGYDSNTMVDNDEICCVSESEIPITRTVRINLKDSEHYVFSNGQDYVDVEVNFVEKKQELGKMLINVNNVNTTYDGNEHELVSVSTIPFNVNVLYSLNGGIFNDTVPKATNAGTYTITIIASCDGCETEERTVTSVINKKVLEIPTGKTYYLDECFNGISYPQDFVENYNQDLMCFTEFKADINGAGSYKFVIRLLDENNYMFSNNETIVTATAKVIERDNKIMNPIITKYNGTYDGNEHELISISNLPEGAIVTYDGENSIPKGINAGTYVISIKITCDGYETYETTVTSVINKKVLEIPTGKTYYLDECFNGISYPQDFVENYDSNLMCFTEFKADINGAGSYKFVIRLLDENNYMFSNNETIVTATAKVIERDNKIMNPTITTYSGVFDDNNHQLINVSNIPEGSVVYYSIDNGNTYTTETPNNKYAGTYYYLVKIECDGYETIIKKVNVTIDRKVIDCPTAKEVTYTGFPVVLVDGYDQDKMYCDIIDENPICRTNAGNYNIFVSARQDYIFANGQTYVLLNCKINKAKLVIKSLDANKIVDGTPLVGNDYVTEGLVGSENIKVTFTGSQTEIGSSENTFTYEFIDGAKASNYDVEVKFGTLTISPKKVMEPVITTYSGVFDDNNHQLINVSNIPEGSVVYYSIDNGNTYTTEVPKQSEAGIYYYLVKVECKDYEVYTKEVNCEIERKVIENPISVNTTYNGESQLLVSGFDIETMFISYLDEDPSYGKDAGTYNIFIEARSNYIFKDGNTYTLLTSVISPKKMTIESLSVSIINNYLPLLYNHYVTDGLVGSENVKVTFTGYQSGIGSSKNTFTYEFINGGKKENYDVELIYGTLTIEPRKVMNPTINGYNGTYDNKSHDLFIVSNIPEESTIYYSLDNGKTWENGIFNTAECGEYNILVRIECNEYEEYKETVKANIEHLSLANLPSVIENKVNATYYRDGHYDLVTYCECGEELSRETITIDRLKRVRNVYEEDLTTKSDYNYENSIKLNFINFANFNKNVVGYIVQRENGFKMPVYKDLDREDVLTMDINSDPEFDDEMTVINNDNTDYIEAFDNYIDSNYYNEHPYFIYYTKGYGTYVMEICSTYVINDEYNIPTGMFDSEELFNEYKEYVTENAVYNTGIEYNYGDRLVSLVTYNDQGEKIILLCKLTEIKDTNTYTYRYLKRD